MFTLIAEAYNRLMAALPPELRRALFFGLGAFFMLAAWRGGKALDFATKIGS